MSWQEKTHMNYTGKKTKHFKIINKNKRNNYYQKQKIIDFPKKFYKLMNPILLAIFIYSILCILAKILIKR